MAVDESYKPAFGYEGLYEVSNKGNIRKADGNIVKQWTDRDGYRHVMLRKDDMYRSWLVHRLVAMTFIGLPPEGKPFVNHLDSNRANNELTNLEWCSPRENTQHAIRAGRFKECDQYPGWARWMEIKKARRQQYDTQ